MGPAATRAVIAATTLSAGHHRFRLGIILLGLVVLGVIVWVVVRLTQQRRDGGGALHHGHGDEWRRESPLSAPTGPSSQPEVAESRPLPGPPSQPPRAPVPQQPPTPQPPPTPPVAPAGGWAVETHGLTKRFGTTVAVDDVELLVPRGCAFGYLGPNGAGKTTLIRTLLGLTHADSGTMSLLGIPVPQQRGLALARVGAIVDEARFFGHISGRDNLRLLSAARGHGAEDRIPASLARVGLGERADDRVASYSMGMRQRLGVAACLLGDPELLILDEPMNGLDPAGIHEMRQMIRDLVAEGRTVMLSSHLLDEVERTCDAVAIVDHGKVVRQGPIDELLRGAAAAAVRLECSDPAGAARLVEAARLGTGVTADAGGIVVSLPPGSSREAVAEVVRQLVSGGFAIYRVNEVRASLEDWFLSVTSRLGEPV